MTISVAIRECGVGETCSDTLFKLVPGHFYMWLNLGPPVLESFDSNSNLNIGEE